MAKKPTNNGNNEDFDFEHAWSLFRLFVEGLLRENPEDTWKDHIARIVVGALGGLFFAACKNFFSGRIGIYGLLAMSPGADRSELIYGYVSAALMTSLFGAVTGWLAGQRSKRLTFLFGILGTQLLLTFFPSLHEAKATSTSFGIHLISTAYAEPSDSCVGPTSFDKGFKAFFGVTYQYDKYAVVVASGSTAADAQNKLKALSTDNPDMKLVVGQRACASNYYPVFASDFLPLSDAKAALEKARKAVPDAYLTPGPLSKSES